MQLTTISGVVKLDNGTPAEAMVWAWSEKGGSINVKTGQNGVFSLQVPFGGQWHLGAGRDVSNFPYKSSEIIVDADKASISVELVW